MSNGTAGARLEACVDSLPAALAAVAGGAHRLELCVRLDVDGLTPPAALVAAVRAAVPIPLVVLVRPSERRDHEPHDRSALLEGVAMARMLGADGVAVGALDGVHLDEPLLSACVTAAGPLAVTVHRAFDEVADRGAALAAVRRLGVRRILTSGGAVRAAEALDTLAATVRDAGGLEVVAAGRITPEDAPTVVARTGVPWVHAHSALLNPAGEMDPGRVRALVEAIRAG